MNKYIITTIGGSRFSWTAHTPEEAKKEAEQHGYKIIAVDLVRSNVPVVCPGVVCKCGTGARCPAHDKN